MASYEGRFKDCAASEFPAVTNYDYRDNLSIRGANNRSFRWEDVSIKPIYLYEEVTVSGSFEGNLYNTHHPVTNNTGVNYITTLNQTIDNTGYLGWTVTGGFTLWVGMSGINIGSGLLSGLRSGIVAHPIEGDEAIGLYSWTGYNSMPYVIGGPLPSGEGHMLPGNVHQVYGQARAIYSTGATEYLNVYVRGWNSSTIVAYHHPFSGTWGLTPPTNTGFLISKTGYTEVKYLFTTSDYPAATPTGYDLVITPMRTGGFILIDDFHIDARMKSNAFIDHIFPTGYMLEITPDIGAHNVLDMFTESNPYLRILGPYAAQLGNLEDNLDNTVTATVDATDWDDAINNRYSKYLWRILPLEHDGSFGRGSLPSKFQYIGDMLDKYFSVTSISENPDSTTKTIVGTKPQRSYITVDGEQGHPGLSYPSDTTWKLVYILTQANATVALQAIDPGGATSSVKYLELSNKVFNQNYQALWNTIDEHGLLMDIERLPNESNQDYVDRIKDVSINRGGSTFVGIVNGGIRELGLKKVPQALTLRINTDTSGPLAEELLVETSSVSVKIHTASMIMEETLYVDPVYKTVELSKDLYEYPIYCEVDNGKPLKLSDIHFHKDNEEYPTDNIRLFIDDEDALGKHIRIKYAYYEVFRFRDYPCLGDLAAVMNSFVDRTNNKLLVVTLNSALSGNEACLGLYMSSFSIFPGSDYYMAWAPMYLKRVSDKFFREYVRGNQPYRKSKFYEYVNKLKVNSRTLWGSIEADRDYWDAASREDLSFDTIPTITDPPLAEFYSLKTGVATRIESVQAWGRNYKGFGNETMFNISIGDTQFQPGIGYGDDLKPDIYFLNNEVETAQEQYINISRQRLNNETVVFSGQR